MPFCVGRQKGKTMEEKKIYDKQTKQWIPVSEDCYEAIVYERNLHRDKMRKRGECACPFKEKWKCDTDCVGCEFRKAGRWISLDIPISSDTATPLIETIADTSVIDMDEKEAREILNRELAKEIRELDEVDTQICQMYARGYSESRISREINIPYSTLQRRWKKLKNKLFCKLKKFR